jgi:non-canonical purine NTP pyrophosphatase, rdgB/HAM1 family
MNKLVIATSNSGKLKEIQEFFKELPFKILSLKDVGFNDVIDEDQDTFEGNARKKALEVMKYTGEITLADDSGLEVDALGGKPGVFSARFAGIDASDEQNNEKLLRLMENVPYEKRQARFRCVIVVAFPNGQTLTAEGICEGRIGHQPKGTNGFGYDPLFIVDKYGKTFSELEQNEKII